MPYKTEYEDSIIECPHCKKNYEEEVPKGIKEKGKVKVECFFCHKEFEVEAWQFEKL